MTREEAIKHWAEDIIPVVFKAEDKLRQQLLKVLDEYKDDPTTALETYCHTIAKEIVSSTTDEELKRL